MKYVQRIEEIVDAIEYDMVKLTEWEEDFLDNIMLNFHEENLLSFKQKEIIDRIYDKIN